jgi:hypothetical protein
MRELHGVLSTFSARNLKREALIFDKFHLWRTVDDPAGLHKQPEDFDNELSYLMLQGMVVDSTPVLLNNAPDGSATLMQATERKIAHVTAPILYDPASGKPGRLRLAAASMFANDAVTRLLSSTLAERTNVDLVPICELSPLEVDPDSERAENVLTVSLGAFPVPDDQTPWQDIIDFKLESHDKIWAFKRFVNTLATKKQTDVETRDDIEWSLNEYTKAMDRFKIKRSASFIETYIIPTVEAFESFKPSAFVKGIVSVKKRKLELLEGEASSPGRECAYIFDAQQRFGLRRSE